MTPLLTILAVLPGLLIAFFIYRMDKFEKESPLHLGLCFLGGMLMTVPAIYLEKWGGILGWEYSAHIGLIFMYALLIVGVSEELVKYVLLVIYPYPRKFFNEPFDGIIYAVMIGMGFATLENLLYAGRLQSLDTTIIRAFTAVPAHAIFAIISGYYVGLSKFHPEKKWAYLFIGLGWAILLHGLYDFFLIQPLIDFVRSFSLLLLLFTGYWAWLLIQRLQAASPFSEKENSSSEIVINTPEIINTPSAEVIDDSDSIDDEDDFLDEIFEEMDQE